MRHAPGDLAQACERVVALASLLGAVVERDARIPAHQARISQMRAARSCRCVAMARAEFSHARAAQAQLRREARAMTHSAAAWRRTIAPAPPPTRLAAPRASGRAHAAALMQRCECAPPPPAARGRQRSARSPARAALAAEVPRRWRPSWQASARPQRTLMKPGGIGSDALLASRAHHQSSVKRSLVFVSCRGSLRRRQRTRTPLLLTAGAPPCRGAAAPAR
jgi:hypothetical protein